MQDAIGRRARLFLTAVGLVLAVSACGAHSTEPSAHSASLSTSTATTPSDDAGGAEVGPLEQLVRVNAYGVAFGLPKEWHSVAADEVKDSAALKRAAHRMQIPAKRLDRLMSLSGAETVSISPDAPYDRVVTAGLPGGIPTDAQLTQRLTSQGADLGPIRHSTTPAGAVTRVAYAVPQGRGLGTGELLFVDTSTGSILINVTSNVTARPTQIGDEIWRTLQSL